MAVKVSTERRTPGRSATAQQLIALADQQQAAGETVKAAQHAWDNREEVRLYKQLKDAQYASLELSLRKQHLEAARGAELAKLPTYSKAVRTLNRMEQMLHSQMNVMLTGPESGKAWERKRLDALREKLEAARSELGKAATLALTGDDATLESAAATILASLNIGESLGEK